MRCGPQSATLHETTGQGAVHEFPIVRLAVNGSVSVHVKFIHVCWTPQRITVGFPQRFQDSRIPLRLLTVTRNCSVHVWSSAEWCVSSMADRPDRREMGVNVVRAS